MSAPARGVRLWSRLVLGAVVTLVVAQALGVVAFLLRVAATARPYVPPPQSAVVLGLSLVVLRAASLSRRQRQRIVVGALLAAAAVFAAMSLPERFVDTALMVDGLQRVEDREAFEERFRLDQGILNFHSHLGDVVIGALDQAFGASGDSSRKAYSTASFLAGLLFLSELLLVAIFWKWSRRACRYVGLALGVPVSLLYFGYWELGYFSVAVGAVPLLLFCRHTNGRKAQASLVMAGALEGLHTALHMSGMLGIAGGVLAALRARNVGSGVLRATIFGSTAVALFSGWVFIYLELREWSLVSLRSVTSRALLTSVVDSDRLITPLLSIHGLEEIGLIGALAGVPFLGLVLLKKSSEAALPVALYALPGLLFVFQWSSTSFPQDWDLFLSFFPGMWAALWVLAASPLGSRRAFVLAACMHVLLWSTMGNAFVLGESAL